MREAQEQAEQQATQFETQGLYQQYGMGGPEAALRARGHDLPAGQKPTSQMQNYQYAQSLGPDDRAAFNQHRGGQTINVGGENFMPDTRPNAPQGGVVPRPGSAEDYKRSRDAEKDTETEQMAVQKSNKKIYGAKNVIAHASRALDKIDWKTTGFIGSKMAGIEGSGAYDLRNIIDTLRANIGFDTLGQMREMSPTGGALGQVSEIELKLLYSAITALDANMSEAEVRKGITEIQGHYENMIYMIENQSAPPGYDMEQFGGGESDGRSDAELDAKYGG